MRRILPLVLIAVVGCGARTTVIIPPAPTPAPKGLAGGVKYLVAQQSEDGAWRSDVYATFKDGTALTPLVLCSLLDAGGDESAAVRKKAAAWLAAKAKPDGTIDEGPDGLPYPVYTAACSVIGLSHDENKEHTKARDAWLKYLLDRQLTEQNGWKSEDKQYGGWGYYPGIPKKPTEGESVPSQHLLESNLSATTFAIEALDAVSPLLSFVPPSPLPAGWDGPRFWKERSAAVQFVLSCANEDGGFHFIYDDPVRNKAGAVEPQPASLRFHSYGSATADGVRALQSIEGPGIRWGREITLARNWLVVHFAPDLHPGEYIPTHERNRNAVYFYYARSVAKAFRSYGATEIKGRHWADSLSEALLARQKPDGSWENQLDQQRENDPVLATAYAVSALAECRNAPKK